MKEIAVGAECVVFEVRNQVAYVALNRPEKHNGLDYALFRELIAVAKRIRKDRTIRAVILCGQGESFCAGLDFKAVSRRPSMVPKLFLKLPWTSTNAFQRVAYIWRTLPVPVICAVQGSCFGGGLQIALGCDYRIATPDSRWSIMEVKWGLIPDMSATTTLATLTRYDRALELTMTGRIFSGVEGLEYGLVSQLSDNPLADAEVMALRICKQSPDTVAATKMLFRKTWQASSRCALWWERWIQMRLLGRKNQRIAMQNGLAADKEQQPFNDRSLF